MVIILFVLFFVWVVFDMNISVVRSVQLMSEEVYGQNLLDLS